ncbi:hypothetical protein [Peterkaempfera bronchialis]|uniref:hypothetical protein n=1 Tax=Peterkaempfera bronchialis TaxID=2126346 RepID=UPI003C2F88B2
MPDPGRHRRRPTPTAVPGPLRRLAAAVLFGAAGACAGTLWGSTGAWFTDITESETVHVDTAPEAPAVPDPGAEPHSPDSTPTDRAATHRAPTDRAPTDRPTAAPPPGGHSGPDSSLGSSPGPGSSPGAAGRTRGRGP